MTRRGQQTVPVVYIRGGTSKGLFFHEKDIPSPGPRRDALLKRFMGTPDALQIDGMGGSRIVTSKIAIVKKSTHPDADVDYTFAQAGVRDDYISYEANCGNISSGVGPFAIDEGLVENFRPGVSIAPGMKTQEVRIFNTNTSKIMISHVPIDEGGEVLEKGDFEISGVPGTGAPILMDYCRTIGATQGKGSLPTGHAIDIVNVGGKNIEMTICDVANPIIFVHAKDFGITAHEASKDLTANEPFLARVKELRGKAAQLLGMCKDWEKVDEQSPFVPAPVLIAKSAVKDGHLSSRLILENTCHESMAGTAAICTAACSRTPGTVVYNQIELEALLDEELRISHPLGIMPVFIKTVQDMAATTSLPEFLTLSFVRTARRIMDAQLYIPKDFAYTPAIDEKLLSTNGNGHVVQDPNGIKGSSSIQDSMGIQDTKANGTTTKLSHVNTKIPPVTDIFADFIATTRFEDLDASVVDKLKELLIDFIGVTTAGSTHAESTAPFLEGLVALGATTGMSTVIGQGARFTSPYAALLNAVLGHSLDFDDTYAPGALHPGVTAISAALTQAELSESPGTALLAGLSVGYEVICRLGHELGFKAYNRGFHNTATAGIFGAVAVICSLKRLPAPTISMALGLAGSKAAGSMQYLDNGSWNKRLHPGFAAHDAFVCVALAEAGVVGATHILEGKFGFFNAYTAAPTADINWDWLVTGLGSKWTFLETAIKPFPACRMTHGLIEIAGRLRTSAGTRKVRSIHTNLSPAMIPIVGEPTTNKMHPQNVVDAQFSAYYQTALAWLDGSATGWAVYDRMHDEDVNELLDRITCVADASLENFASRIVVAFQDGSEVRETLAEPLGERGNPLSRELVDKKFSSLAQPVFGVEKTVKIMDLVAGIEVKNVRELLNILQ